MTSCWYSVLYVTAHRRAIYFVVVQSWRGGGSTEREGRLASWVGRRDGCRRHGWWSSNASAVALGV